MKGEQNLFMFEPTMTNCTNMDKSSDQSNINKYFENYYNKYE